MVAGVVQRIGRVFLAIVLIVGYLQFRAAEVEATAGAVTLSVGSTSVAPGSKVTLKAGTPVSGAGTVSQEIVQEIDPDKVRLTSASDISYPNGWNLSVSTDGTTFTTTLPSNSAGWAAVRAVKASGSVVSLGTENGYQIASGTGTGSASVVTVGSIAASGLGDGFEAFFDPARTRVFNLYHHSYDANPSRALLDCHIIATGATCAGFPYSTGYPTGDSVSGRIIGTKLWFNTGTSWGVVMSNVFYGKPGFGCVDLSLVLASGGNPRMCTTPFVSMSSTQNYLSELWQVANEAMPGQTTFGTTSETRLWSFTGDKLVCLDTALAAACAGMPTNGWPVPDAPVTSRNLSLDVIDGRIFYAGSASLVGPPTYSSGVVGCVLASNPMVQCPGWIGAKYSTTENTFFQLLTIPDASGRIVAVCGSTTISVSGDRCYSLDGQPYSKPSSLPLLNGGRGITVGSRIYGTGSPFWCWDAARNNGAGGLCFSGNIGGYTQVPDPALPNCVWGVYDPQPVVRTYDISGANPVLGCANHAGTLLRFPATAVVPRMACASSPTGVRSWRSFTLLAPASVSPNTYTSAKLTIKTSLGAAVDGWTAVPITVNTPVNLSALSPSVTGQDPSFEVTFTGVTGALTTGSARVEAVGDAPELCLTPTVVAPCPQLTGTVRSLAGTTTSVTANASATDSQSNTTPFAPASVNLTVTTPTPEQCGSSLSGVASVLGTTVPVAGVTATLLDVSGNPILDASSNPVTTVTAADGSYTFGQLFPGGYKVRFDDLGTRTVATATVTAAGSGSTSDNSAASSLVSPTATLTADVDGVVNAEYRAPAGATNDVSSGAQGAAQTVSILANDNATSGATLTASTVRLCSSGQTPPNCTIAPGNATGVVVPGEGRYTVNSSGVVTFTPCNGANNPVVGCTGVFAGTATPLRYQVSDSTAAVVSATVTPTVVPLPTAAPDSQSGPYDTIQEFTPHSNDTPGAGTTLAVSPVGLCSSSTTSTGGCNATMFPVSGQGTYVLSRTTGQVYFDPLPTFIGTATPIKYLAVDALGQKVFSTITPTVLAPPAPTGVADTSTGAQGASQSISPFANDTPGASGMTFTASTVKLCSSGQTSPNCTATSLVVNGQGTYSVNTSTGAITFQPCSSVVATTCPSGAFTGVATPVAYQVGTNTSQHATSTYTPTVVPLPSAVADAQTGAWDTNQTYDPTANDSAGSGATLVSVPSGICASTVTAVASCTSTTLTIANQGTYTLNTTTGAVTFDPVSTFSGTATPIKYAVVDSLGQKVLSTITPTVLPPPAPTGNPDTTTGKVGQVQVVNPVSNDTTSAGTFTASTVRLCSTGQTPPSCSATSVVVSGQGTFAANTSTGEVTFTPCSSVSTNCPSGAFTGTATPVTYQVSTSMSQVASSTYTPRVAPFPTAVADAQTGPWDTNQVYSPTANDTAGSGASLVAVPSGICVNSTTDPALCTSNSLTISNQGTYTLNTTTGTVTFDPLPAFTGPATPIKYAVADNFGQKSLATITPTVTPPAAPTANPQSKTVIPGGIATFTTLTGAGGLASTGGPAFNNAATCLIAPAAPATCATSVSVAGEGTWSVNTGTGVVTFTANSGVTSGTKTPVTYRVTDSTGQTATSTLTPIVPPPPTANPDSSVDEQNETQVLSPLSNDSAASSTSLNPSSVKLCPTNVSAPYNGTNCNLSSLSIADVGKFTVNSDGTVTFVPCTAVAGVTCAGSYVGGSNVFTGTATARYVVADGVGQFGSSTLSAQALPPPAVKPSNDSGTSPFATSVVFDPLANDSGGTTTGPSMSAYSSVGTASPDPGTLRLCGSGESAPGCTATSVNKPEGTYVLDQATGRITFTPAPNYVGTPDAPPLYMVCNQMGGTWAPLTPSTSCSTAKLTPTIQPPSSPTATNDAQTGPYNTPLIISVLGNDTKDPALTISGSTVKLCASAQTAPNCTATTLSSPGEGTYTVNPATGQVTFTPESSFAGTPTLRPGYQFTDSYGATASATITPTITAPPAPTASPQTKRVLPGTSVNFTNVIGASALATGTGLRAGTLGGPCLVDPADTVCKTSFTIAGQGDWSIDQATGVPTFVADPAASVGTKTAVTFRVTDAVGATATATLTPVVPPDPTVTPDSGSAGLDTNQTFSVLVNDNPGTGTTFDVTSVRLCGNGETPPNCSATTLVVANQGTYSVSSTGVVTFDPLPDFAGAATPVSYQVTDSMGRTVNTTISATVTAVPPTPSADTVLVPRGGSRSFEPIHGTGGLVTRNTGGAPLTTSTTCIIDPATSICGTTSVVIAGEGVYSVDVASGVVTFTADPSAPDGPLTAVSYEITDAAGNTVGSTLTPTVVPPPTAQADLSSGVQGESQVIQVLFNDAPGDPAQPLTPSTVRICATTETSPACTRSTLTIAGEGTYVVQTDGRVVFTPVPAFVGTGTLLAYTVEDSIGQKAASTLRVAVTATNSEPANPAAPSNPGSAPPNQPTVLDQVTSTRPLTPVYLRPTLDGSASPNATFDFSRVELWDEARGIWTTSIDNEQGRWTVVGELVEFVPKAGFTGVADVRFRVPDSTGQMASASLTVTVAPGELPRTGAGFLVLMWWALVVVLFGARLSRSTLARHAT